MQVIDAKQLELCQRYLHGIYAQIHTQFPVKTQRDYGEILFEGVTQLLSNIQLTETDVFIDLGSGKGKLVNQIFLQTSLKKVYGIEQKLDLHEQAEKAAQKIRYELPEFFCENRELSFINGDFLTHPLQGMTIAFINATCFPQSLIQSLGTVLNEVQSLHTILSTRPISTLKRFSFQRMIRIECSWDTALVYLYLKKNLIF